MSKIKVKQTNIKDLYVIEPTVYQDERGYFMEIFNQKEFSKLVAEKNFVQDNQSFSFKGVLRGLHFQYKYVQAKLVRVIEGEIFDVAVDLRKDSNTYSNWFGVKLSGENKKSLYLPEGFAHGFLVLSERAILTYKCSELYHPEYEGGMIWNDRDINIEWPLDKIDNLIISNKDKNLQKFKELNLSF